MHHRKTYMYINFQQNRVSRSVKPVHTSLHAKICKLHKFATCNYNFEKSRLSDMLFPFTDILADFEINWPSYEINELPQKEIISTDNRRPDGRTDGRADGQMEIFFEKRKNY